MPQLAQAYIHLRPYWASPQKIRALGRAAEKIAIEKAGEIYGPDVIVQIELEEGSLRTRITVLGAIALASYGAVANYKGFKESVIELCDDARDFAVDVCKPFVRKAGVSEEEVYRFERRLKTPGKLYRLNKHLERLQRSVSDLSANALNKELAKARAELRDIEGDLTQADAIQLEKALNLERLPPSSHWPEPEPQKVVIARDEEAQAQLFNDTQTDTNPDVEGARRIVYKKTVAVPKTIKRRKHRKRHEASPRLLPS